MLSAFDLAHHIERWELSPHSTSKRRDAKPTLAVLGSQTCRSASR